MNFHHWKDVVPFFTKAERWTGPTEQSTLARIIDISNYGTSGRYSIMPNPFNYKVINSWIFRVIELDNLATFTTPSVINSRSIRVRHFLEFQITNVATEALRSLGIPIGNVNSKNLEDEGFWSQAALTLENGRRHGTYREATTYSKSYSILQMSPP